ncbi:IS66 family insertion sequence element accessory protein TnpB [Desulforhopalus vacuolatus]|nr:IS66 family insertion sequence element accessory protein TnpB [Desulforhopalus vacuolatus]
MDHRSILVSEQLELNTFSGNLFVFCNRKRNMLKILA